jgi:hypothetical protein
MQPEDARTAAVANLGGLASGVDPVDGALRAV